MIVNDDCAANVAVDVSWLSLPNKLVKARGEGSLPTIVGSVNR